jgi:prepilin-type N-terminal cleavage/methylation domain-containing protein
LTKSINGRAGFSLLEVIATLLVVSLLILALSPFVGVMLATWSRGSEVANLVEQRVRGLGLLRNELRRAIVWSDLGIAASKQLLFRGTAKSMTFPTVAGLGIGRSGIEMISVTVGGVPNMRTIVQRRAQISGLGHTAFANPVVIYSGGANYVFRYYSRSGEEKEVWDDPASLPARIVLHISGRTGTTANIAPVEFTTFAGISTGCLTGRQSQGCPSAVLDPGLVMYLKAHGLDPTQ